MKCKHVFQNKYVTYLLTGSVCFLLTLNYCFQCFDDTEKLQWEHIESEWKQEKQKALNALAGTSEEFLNLSLQPEVKRKFFMYRTPFFVIYN